MREHETREPEAVARKPREARGSAPEHRLLSLQRSAGNAAVAGQVARAVEIEEMTSNTELRDQANPTDEVKEEVTGALHGAAGGGGTGAGGPATEEEQPTGGGADTLPPGGHATMEQETG